jgi:tetratricopeptide (TPR) repeat protein
MSGAPDPTIVAQARALFYEQDRRAEAFALLAAEIARFPDHEDAENYLAFLYATDGRYQDALRLFTRLIERNPLPRYMANIFFCRTAAANCILEGRPVNDAGRAG